MPRPLTPSELAEVKRMRTILADAAKALPPEVITTSADTAVAFAYEFGIPDAETHREALYQLYAFALQDGMGIALNRVGLETVRMLLAR